MDKKPVSPAFRRALDATLKLDEGERQVLAGVLLGNVDLKELDCHDDLLTTAEVARIFGRSTSFVNTLIKQGKLPAATGPVGPGRGNVRALAEFDPPKFKRGVVLSLLAENKDEEGKFALSDLHPINVPEEDWAALPPFDYDFLTRALCGHWPGWEHPDVSHLLARIDRGIRRLSPPNKYVLVMAARGLSTTEIAARCDAPHKHVFHRYHHAIDQLRQALLPELEWWRRKIIEYTGTLDANPTAPRPIPADEQERLFYRKLLKSILWRSVPDGHIPDEDILLIETALLQVRSRDRHYLIGAARGRKMVDLARESGVTSTNVTHRINKARRDLRRNRVLNEIAERMDKISAD